MHPNVKTNTHPPQKKVTILLIKHITRELDLYGRKLEDLEDWKELLKRLKDSSSSFSNKELEAIDRFANGTLLKVVDWKLQDSVLALLNSGIQFNFNYVEKDRLNRRDKKYYTFLDRAILSKNLPIVNLLLEAEAAQDNDLFNRERNSDIKWHPALEHAVTIGNKEIVSRLLKEISAECSEAFFKLFSDNYRHPYDSMFMAKLQAAKDEFNAQQKLKMEEQDKSHADLSLSFSQLEIQEELGQLPTDPLDEEARKKYYSITENASDLRLSPTAAEFEPEPNSSEREKENLVVINQNLKKGNNVHAKDQGYFPLNRANNGPVFPYPVPFGALPTPPCYYRPQVFIPSYYPPPPVIFTPPPPVGYYPERIFVLRPKQPSLPNGNAEKKKNAKSR